MSNKTLKVLCEDEQCTVYDLQAVADKAYSQLGQTLDLAIEIAFVSEDEIKDLNREQRAIDKVTDVLSFPYLDGIRGKILSKADFDEFDLDEDGFLLGSICICEQRAKEQAEEYGHSLKREVCYLALHGILHCFGYDHIESQDEEEMTALAEKIMSELNLKRS